MLEGWQLRVMVDVQALMVQVEGMKAENKQREIQGLSQAYGEDSFYGVQSDLLSLADQLR